MREPVGSVDVVGSEKRMEVVRGKRVSRGMEVRAYDIERGTTV